MSPSSLTHTHTQSAPHSPGSVLAGPDPAPQPSSLHDQLCSVSHTAGGRRPRSSGELQQQCRCHSEWPGGGGEREHLHRLLWGVALQSCLDLCRCLVWSRRSSKSGNPRRLFIEHRLWLVELRLLARGSTPLLASSTAENLCLLVGRSSTVFHSLRILSTPSFSSMPVL